MIRKLKLISKEYFMKKYSMLSANKNDFIEMKFKIDLQYERYF